MSYTHIDMGQPPHPLSLSSRIAGSYQAELQVQFVKESFSPSLCVRPYGWFSDHSLSTEPLQTLSGGVTQYTSLQITSPIAIRTGIEEQRKRDFIVTEIHLLSCHRLFHTVSPLHHFLQIQYLHIYILLWNVNYYSLLVNWLKSLSFETLIRESKYMYVSVISERLSVHVEVQDSRTCLLVPPSRTTVPPLQTWTFLSPLSSCSCL